MSGGLDMDAIAAMAEDAVTQSRTDAVPQGSLARDRAAALHVAKIIQQANAQIAEIIRASAEDHGLLEQFDAKACWFDTEAAVWRPGQPPQPRPQQGPPA